MIFKNDQISAPLRKTKYVYNSDIHTNVIKLFIKIMLFILLKSV